MCTTTFFSVLMPHMVIASDNSKQIFQVHCSMPAIIVFPVARYPYIFCTRTHQFLKCSTARSISFFISNDSNQLLHHFLQAYCTSNGCLLLSLSKRINAQFAEFAISSSSIVPGYFLLQILLHIHRLFFQTRADRKANYLQAGLHHADLQPHSPAAKSPGTVDICVSASTRMPPIM